MADSLQLLAKRKKFGRGILRPFLTEDGIVKEAALLSLQATTPELTKFTAESLAVAELPLSFDGRLMKAGFTISTPTEDRSEDVVPPGSIGLTNYASNPVVLFDHGQGSIDHPIGKSRHADGSLALTVTKSGIAADCYFSQKNDNAQQIAALVDEGILNAASVHIANIEAEQRSRGSGHRPGLLIKSCELLEWSVVGIPDNPEAVRKLLSRGRLAGEVMRDDIREYLNTLAPAKKLVLGKGMTFEPVPAEVLKMAEEEPTDQPAAEEPQGAQLVAGFHAVLKSLLDQLAQATAMVENEKVITGMGSVQKQLSDLITACEGVYKDAYPDGMGLGNEDEADPDEAQLAKGVRAFLLAGQANRYQAKGLVQGIENLCNARNLSPDQKKNAARMAAVLKRIIEASESEAAKKWDADEAIRKRQAEEAALAPAFTELLSKVQKLVDDRADYMPARD